MLGWCTSCSGKRQIRAETSAPPPEVSSICVNPCNLWEASPASGSVSSVQSVGEYSQASGSVNSVNSVGEPTHPTNLCQSVQSVGEYSQAEGSVNSVNSVENLRTKPNSCYSCYLCSFHHRDICVSPTLFYRTAIILNCVNCVRYHIRFL